MYTNIRDEESVLWVPEMKVVLAKVMEEVKVFIQIVSENGFLPI